MVIKSKLCSSPYVRFIVNSMLSSKIIGYIFATFQVYSEIIGHVVAAYLQLVQVSKDIRVVFLFQGR